MKFYHRFPELVKQFCWAYDGFIVGGAALYASGLPDVIAPKDWDVVIPFYRWHEAAQIIPKGAVVNSFGGWRIKDQNGIDIDVWPGDAAMMGATYYKRPYYIFHPKTRTFFEVSTI